MSLAGVGVCAPRYTEAGGGFPGPTWTGQGTQDLTLQLELTHQLRLSLSLGKLEVTAVPLNSMVWLMRAFCSWEINLQASKDTLDGGDLLGDGRHHSGGDGPSFQLRTPVPHPCQHWTGARLHQGPQGAGQTGIHGLLF